MTSAEAITDAEWKVMDVLWDRPPISSAEVVEALQNTTEWSPKTIRTLLARLISKGFVRVNDDSTPRLFEAVVARQKCTQQKTKSFIDRVFNGSANLMFLQFVKGQDLSNQQIEEFKRILDNKKGESGPKSK
ncbi:MAG: BlaI/MecI/CopY family transcriptional regulator [Clostridia bacterium]|nr:BlaI/MecI/CopY family transcriptional regulator [Clostridia bacterium]MDR3645454.1 BlaI/MecI/CopY family transcriptional regulator [Clostridia bacterium]